MHVRHNCVGSGVLSSNQVFKGTPTPLIFRVQDKRVDEGIKNIQVKSKQTRAGVNPPLNHFPLDQQ